MSSLAIATVVFGAVLLLFKTLLSGAVLRRLRDHTARLGVLEATPRRRDTPIPGDPVPAFTTRTEDGVVLNRSALSEGRWIIGVFSATCGTCRVHLPDFLATADLPRDRVLAVVLGEVEEATDLIDQAAARCTIVTEPNASPLATAFGVRSVPQYVAIEDGVIRGVGVDVGVLATAAATAH
ncbi:MAG TPA: hypothetical protein VM677_06870 [Actinokineospora sp.]|jgi:hypothetical protein|nr:hypothetical protein [Actinokineospora sp.]